MSVFNFPWTFRVFFNSVYFYEIDELFQELAEKVYKGVVAHDRQVKVALVYTGVSVDTHTAISSNNARHLKSIAFHLIELHFFLNFFRTFLSDLTRHWIINVAHASIAVDHADGPIDLSLVWFVREEVVRKINRNAVDGAERIPFLPYFVCWKVELFFILKDNQFVVSWFQTLPENHPVDLNGFVLVADGLYLHHFGVERVSVWLIECVERILFGEVELMWDEFFFADYVDWFLFVGSEKAYFLKHAFLGFKVLFLLLLDGTLLELSRMGEFELRLFFLEKRNTQLLGPVLQLAEEFFFGLFPGCAVGTDEGGADLLADTFLHFEAGKGAFGETLFNFDILTPQFCHHGPQRLVFLLWVDGELLSRRSSCCRSSHYCWVCSMIIISVICSSDIKSS